MSVSYVAELQLDYGEKVHIRVTVKPKCDTDIPFTVKSATYELICGEEIEASGDCTITDHVLDAFIAPENTGTYRLKYTYQIADETWVDNIKLKVG